MGFKDKLKKVLPKEKTARQESMEISAGQKPEKHLGKFTAPMIDQEIYSMRNTKPAFRDGKWDKRFEAIEEAIMEKLARNENSILCQVWLSDLEALKNER